MTAALDAGSPRLPKAPQATLGNRNAAYSQQIPPPSLGGRHRWYIAYIGSRTAQLGKRDAPSSSLPSLLVIRIELGSTWTLPYTLACTAKSPSSPRTRCCCCRPPASDPFTI